MIYLVIAFAITLVPLYLYHSIFGVEVQTHYLLFAVVSFGSALILSIAYHNVAYWLKVRLISLDETSFTRGQRLKEDKEAAITRESVAFSVLYNNVLFLFLYVVMAFFLLKSASGPYNYVLSVSFTAALMSLFSAVAL